MKAARFLAALALVLAAAPSARAQYLEDYFQNTPPGSWSRYEMKTIDEGGRTSTVKQTISRLPDQDGNVVLEISSEPVETKKAKASSIQIHARPGFLKEKTPLNFVQHVERMILQTEGDKAKEMPMDLMQSMTGGAVQMFDYSQNVARIGDEEVDGRATTHYRVRGTVEMKVVFKTLRYDYENDLWLAAAVPFGRVKEHIATTDSKGKKRSTSDMLLLESGDSGATSKIQGEVEKVEMPKLPFGR